MIRTRSNIVKELREWRGLLKAVEPYRWSRNPAERQTEKDFTREVCRLQAELHNHDQAAREVRQAQREADTHEQIT